MEFHIYPHEDGSGDWVVEAIAFSGDGEIYTAMFSGPGAEPRAQRYHEWLRADQKRALAA